MATTSILFGGEGGWHASDWTDSDDRVRGGSSQSYLKISDDTKLATFTGVLDTSTLGGAGFASQRTTGEDRTWDLSGYDAVQIAFDPKHTDGKRYTFTIKDELLPPDSESGRELSTISWEFDFTKKDVQNQDGKGEGVEGDGAGLAFVTIPWERFKPTYRGRPKEDAKALNLREIRRFSLLMRSFFAKQEGEFSIRIVRICAVKDVDEVQRLGVEKS